MDSLLLEGDINILLQFRGALNRLLGKTAKTLKSIYFPEIYSNYLNLMKEVPLQNLRLCKNLEEIIFDLAAHDMEYTLDLHKLKIVKNEKCNAISGMNLLKTKLNDFKTRERLMMTKYQDLLYKALNPERLQRLGILRDFEDQ